MDPKLSKSWREQMMDDMVEQQQKLKDGLAADLLRKYAWGVPLQLRSLCIRGDTAQ